MKKKLISLVLCFALLFVPMFFLGCNNTHTKQDVSKVYTSIKTDERIKDFFDGNFLKLTFNDVSTSEDDKGYIFPEVYEKYIKSSSGLFFSVIDRNSKSDFISDPVTYAIDSFTKEQTTDIYNKLLNVKSCLINLYNSKSIYEITNAQLRYKQLVNDCNNLVSSLYQLNFAFANYYFQKYYFYGTQADFTLDTTQLSNNNLSDMMWYMLLHLSKVTFNLDVLTFTPSNPLGEVKTSFINAQEHSIMKSFLTICSTTLSKLNISDKLLKLQFNNKIEDVKEVFASFQKNIKNYEIEYDCFIKALNCFDLKNYLLATNKTAFLENSSNFNKSNYQIMQNFLNGKYKAFYNGLNKVNSCF